jgi:hypothetical protein
MMTRLHLQNLKNPKDAEQASYALILTFGPFLLKTGVFIMHQNSRDKYSSCIFPDFFFLKPYLTIFVLPEDPLL